MKITLLSLFLFIFCGTQLFAQNQITGKLLDSKTKEPLIGATVSIKGTTTAASATLTGSFKIKVPDGTVTLVFSYVGYVPKELDVNGSKDLGEILLVANSSSLNEVVINAPVIDRKTPIAVSTVNAEYIEEKGPGQDFPQLLKETPGITATDNGGGYGDSRVRIRGFSANNVSVLINGIPVNDVETGAVFWNDWAGLTDVASSVQVQRGLGASKVAAPSLGGTIAITTRSFDAEPGGYLIGSVGSFNDNKEGISVSSGLSDKGWASSFLLARRSGDGNADGLYFTGYSYFFNLTKVLTKTQKLSFNVMGASQSHGQRFTYNSINTYKAEGNRYNSDWGYFNGQVQSAEVNFYNKPLASLNHIWNINPTTTLSTVASGSWGSGAAQYLTNYTISSSSPYSSLIPGATNEYPRTGDIYSPLDFNAIVKNNQSSADGNALNHIRNQANDHQQYGLISTLKKTVGNIDVTAGVDLRYYEGQHYYQLHDLLGAQYLYDPRVSNTTIPNTGTGDLNNPYHRAEVGDRYNNNYQFNIASEGVFLQTEYSKDNLSAFVSGAISNTGNKRIDYFNYLNSDPNRQSPYVNFLGYQAKGGANYNLNTNNNVYVNIGYMQRSPLVSNVFVNKNNTINPNAVPEKLFSYEAGYGFRSTTLSADINLYRSTYKDRSVAPKTILNTDGSTSSANLSGLNELHQGVELNARYKPTREITFRGMLSVGKWNYITDAGPVQITSDKGTVASINELYVKGLAVGDAAQTTASFAFDYNILPKLKIGPVWNYYANYYASVSAQNITAAGYTPYKIPNYSLFDLNGVFKFKLAGMDASFIGNIHNFFNTAYISDAFDQNGSAFAPAENTPSTIGVFYGLGRTYTTTLKIKF